MKDADFQVLHVVAADTLPAQLRVLRIVLQSQPAGAAQAVLEVGAGQAAETIGRPVEAVRPWLGWFARGLLRRKLRELSARPPGLHVLLHAWSPRAARWCLRLAPDSPVVVEADRLERAPSIGRAIGRQPSNVRFVCASPAARRGLCQDEGSAASIRVIRRAIEYTAPTVAQRAAVRARLQLDERDVVVTPLPPLDRASGAFVAAWAGMLVEKVRPEVRVLIPSDGPEHGRVRRLVKACRHEWMARFAPAHLPLADLVAATDLALCLPSGDAPWEALAWALRAGRPLVAVAGPAIAELLKQGEHAWLCEQVTPAEAARQMLRALEEEAQSRLQAERAAALAAEVFGAQRLASEYAALHAGLAQETWSRPRAGRPG